MRLLPIDSEERFELIAEWLSEKDNHQWLDFGGGEKAPSRPLLKVLLGRDAHEWRLFTDDEDDRPIGVVGLSEVDREFGTATMWVVLGDKDLGGRGYGTRACARILDLGFGELGLGSIRTWVVETNHRSRRMVEKVGFRPVGRLRCCHTIDGEPLDRCLYDLLADEHHSLAA